MAAAERPVRTIWSAASGLTGVFLTIGLGPSPGTFCDANCRALSAAALLDTEWRLLDVLEQHSDATSEQLTAHMGWKRNSTWHLRFGLLRGRLEADLGSAPTTDERHDIDGKPAKFYVGRLAKFDDHSRGFTLHPDVEKALQHLQATQQQ